MESFIYLSLLTIYFQSFRHKVIGSPGWTRTHYVAEVDVHFCTSSSRVTGVG